MMPWEGADFQRLDVSRMVDGINVVTCNATVSLTGFLRSSEVVWSMMIPLVPRELPSK